MEFFSQIIKMLYRIKYWLIFLPVIAALIAIYGTRHLVRTYEVSTTIYTGIASGFTIESGLESGKVDWSSVNNGMDNLISIIKSKSTLREVSIRLYAQHMIYGDSTKDNNYIQAQNFRALVRITPKAVRALIDKSSIDSTIKNLNSYEQASPKNFVYGLFNWYHRHYSYTALSRIEVKRLFNSDMLDIKYSADDPGIAYNTLVLLNKEFARQYEHLRFGETNDVVAYFRNELARLGGELKNSEDELTKYYVDKKIINYGEQTKQVTALARDYELMYYEVLLRYTSATSSVAELEQKIAEQVKAIKNNTVFLEKLKNVTKYSVEIAKLESFRADTTDVSPIKERLLQQYKLKENAAEEDLKTFSNNISDIKYSKEGIVSTTYVEQWVAELINKEKAASELKVMEEVRKSLQSEYGYFSPVGTTIKKKEREIGFTEQSYLAVLQSLNDALMRQKTLQMSSANLKAINPPLFPVSPVPTARKVLVIATYLGTIILIIAFFILLELFDRTVRDKSRAERLIPAKVLGAYPRKNFMRYRRYNNEYEEISTNYLANSIVPYLNPKERPDIINFISSGHECGKSYLIDRLYEYWTERGIRVKILSFNDEQTAAARDYILSSNFSDLFEYANEDIVLVEHRSILDSSIPVGLLREASLNIVVVRADKVWRDIDKIAFERLKEQVKNSPLMLYLNQAKRDVATDFVGMLPPYTKIRSFVYKMTQMGLTSK